MKIGIFTSSTPVGALFPKRSQRAIKFLSDKEHEVILGSLFNNRDFYRSGNIHECANGINELIQLDINILMSAIGGINTSSVLPYINFKKFSSELIVCGFSDTTALLNAVINSCPKLECFMVQHLFLTLEILN